MAKEKLAPKMQVRLDRRRDDWIARVSKLAKQVVQWGNTEGWKIEQHDKEITEELLGTYTVPEVVLRLKGGQIIVAPVALNIAGGDGRVDIEALPTLARVKLIGGKDGWELYADPNVPLRRNWNRANFIQLAHDLLT